MALVSGPHVQQSLQTWNLREANMSSLGQKKCSNKVNVAMRLIECQLLARSVKKLSVGYILDIAYVVFRIKKILFNSYGSCLYERCTQGVGLIHPHKAALKANLPISRIAHSSIVILRLKTYQPLMCSHLVSTITFFKIGSRQWRKHRQKPQTSYFSNIQ